MTIKLGQTIVAATVCLTLALGAAGSFSGITLLETEIDENRSSAQLPSASPLEPQQFFTQWDAYMADHFGYRSVLIKAYTLFRHRVLNAHNAENVILDWLEIDKLEGDQ